MPVSRAPKRPVFRLPTSHPCGIGGSVSAVVAIIATPKVVARCTNEEPRGSGADMRQRRSALLARGLGIFLFLMTPASILAYLGGMAFREGRVDESARFYDAAAATGFPRSLFWQRGISLYYAGRYTEGAAQFRTDLELKASDPEESIWAMVCEARQIGFNAARMCMQSIVKSPRPELLTAYRLFRGDDEDGARLALEETAACAGADGFFAAFYLGLFAEARGDSQTAKRWISHAVTSDYAQKPWNYMPYIARVHMMSRGWTVAGGML